MAARCEVCGKGPRFGNNVSHANNRTRRKWSVNLKTVRVVGKGGATKKRVCTACIRSGLVTKAPHVKSYSRSETPAAA